MHEVVQAIILGVLIGWRLRADGERADARLRDHARDQRRTGRAGDPRRVPELRAVLPPAHRPVRLDPHRDAGDVRARRRGAARVRPLAARPRRVRAVAARHVGARARDRGSAQRRLQDDVPRRRARRTPTTRGRSPATRSATCACSRSSRPPSCSLLLSLLLTRTRFGRAVRATVQNPTAATLLGVDAEPRRRRSASGSASRWRRPPARCTA